MIALDTTVLVRYLVEDDARQTALAAALIDRAIREDQLLFISDVVLCETVWVLSGAYGFAQAQIAAVVRDLLRAKHLAFSVPDQLTRAHAAYAAGKGDFADYLVREHARGAGCDEVATFDKVLLRERGFTAPK